MRVVELAGLSALSYLNWDKESKFQFIKSSLLHVKSEDVFVNYESDGKLIWKKYFEKTKFTDSNSASKSNVFCIAFRKENESVIVFRGTDDVDDALDDLSLGMFDRWCESIEEAINFTKRIIDKYPDDKVYFTGHSLGGALAQIMAKMFNKTAYTFNALGVNDFCNVKNLSEIKREIYSLHLKIDDKSLIDELLPLNDSASISGVIARYNGKDTNFNPLLERGFDKFKIQLGVKYQNDGRKGVFITKEEVDRILYYMDCIDKMRVNSPEVFNYIISSDWTPGVKNHVGRSIILGCETTKHNRTFISEIFNNPSFKTHSMGYFIPFFNDNGGITYEPRKEILSMVCKEVFESLKAKDIRDIICDVFETKSMRQVYDVIEGEMSRNALSKYKFGKTYETYITEKHMGILKDGNELIIGIPFNMVIDDIDGRSVFHMKKHS